MKALLKATEGSARPQVEATYNPKEIQIQRQIQWQQQKSKGKDPGDGLEVEFTQGAGRTLTVELMLDGFEQKKSIKDDLHALDTMLEIDSDLKRPPMCLFSWGSDWLAGVLTQANVTVTMFDPDGNPLRATVNVTIQEAKSADVGSSDDSGS
jgi:hypothetical protein